LDRRRNGGLRSVCRELSSLQCAYLDGPRSAARGGVCLARGTGRGTGIEGPADPAFNPDVCASRAYGLAATPVNVPPSVSGGSHPQPQ
jgi:hypothetical protein